MHTFSFDFVYDQDNTQEEVYENTARSAVMSTLEGFNATIMAYGQTGTGKTFTMEGFKYNCHDPQRGIVPRSIEEIFQFIQNSSNEKVSITISNHLDHFHGTHKLSSDLQWGDLWSASEGSLEPSHSWGQETRRFRWGIVRMGSSKSIRDLLTHPEGCTISGYSCHQDEWCQ